MAEQAEAGLDLESLAGTVEAAYGLILALRSGIPGWRDARTPRMADLEDEIERQYWRVRWWRTRKALV